MRSAAAPAARRSPLRIRHEPPVLDEAVAAAQDMTGDREQQIEIAAALMGMPAEEVRGAVLRLSAASRRTRRVSPGAARGGTAFVVERKGRLTGRS